MPPKRRRRFQGLYYHSSPPKVLPMNGQVSIQRRRRDLDDFSVKLSTIRIWMHEKDIGKLTRILWAGQGNRLRQQASTNAKVKRFLAAVPYAMNNIKDVHQAVVDNTLETLQANLEPPVPPALITCKDANGLNVIHKAAGLGHAMILEYLIGVWPDGVHEIDITGKTPLHWAASCKNNMRCYTLLTQAGCDEEAQDYKMKTPSYYRHKPNEIERAFLVYIPEAPRVSPIISTDWEAFSDDSGDGKKLGIKIPDAITNGFHDRSSDNISEAEVLDSENNTEDIEEAKVDEIEATPEEEEVETPSTPEMQNTADTEEIEDNEDNEDNEDKEDNEERNLNGLNETTTETAKMVEDTVKEAVKIITSNEVEENADNDAPEADVLSEEENNIEVKVDPVKVPTVDTNEVVGNENNEDQQQNDESNDDIVNDSEISNDENQKEATENIDNKKGATENGANQSKDKEDIEDDRKSNDTTNENDAVTVKPPPMEYNDNATDKTEDAIENIEKENEKEGYGTTEEAADMLNESNKTEIDVDDNEIDNSNDVVINSDTEKDDDDDDDTDNNEESIETNVRPKSTFINKKKKKSTDSENSDDDDQDVVATIASEILENSLYDEVENNAEPETEPDATVETAKIDGSFDENHNEEKEYDVESPTSSLAIEGFVQGESGDNTVQSQSAAFVDEESSIQDIIASGDMEQLAQIVLNGDGSKLLDMQAPEAEIQAFLNNVPSYMSKIRRVHEAARSGKIMELQQALDRRKFAIAKDEISPNGASPLHVAVLFGHSDIVRYLASRFPETTSVTDNEGRTALHYAATIKDNGHFYNVLTQLGANSKSMDKLGHSSEFYLDPEQSKDKLTYSQLLNNFGAPELEEELLSDQGQVENNTLQTNPIFKTEQGKYLANTLAEPLIKALTEIANKRPEDPISFLSTYLQKYMRSRNTNSTEENMHNSGKTNSTALVRSPAPASQITRNGQLQNGNSVELEEESADESVSPKLEDRDEHGQSMLHFACARSHRRGGLLHLIEESKIDVTYRDELYRTARDVSLQANQPSNAKEIDRFVLSMAIVGDLAPFEHLAISGYDHIIDMVNDEGVSIIDVAHSKGHDELVEFLQSIRSLEEKREELHELIRENKFDLVKALVSTSIGKWLISAKNYYGRTALHIAILKESEELVDYFVNLCPEALKIADNLERTVLHYAMGTSAVETISHILIQKGAKRTNKDLKGRQPSYYFMNKADIMRLQEEEDENR